MRKPLGALLIGITMMGGLAQPAAAAAEAPAAVSGVETQARTVSIGNRILSSGQAYLGTPYLYGADPSQTNTFDCSSFTFRAFIENGINLPRTANQQMALGIPVTLEEARAGDLVFFRDPKLRNEAGHVAIYMGEGKILHASSSGKGVGYSDLSQAYWKANRMAIKRVIPAHHTVRPGDTLWSVAAERQITVQELRVWNKLKTDVLMPGQELMVQDPDLLMASLYPKGRSHVVQAGDSLWSISRKAQVTVDELRAWNRVSRDAIYIGQRLKLEAPYKSYTVLPGDSLWAVARKTRTPEAVIRKANQLASDALHAGQVLQLPVQF